MSSDLEDQFNVSWLLALRAGAVASRADTWFRARQVLGDLIMVAPAGESVDIELCISQS